MEAFHVGPSYSVTEAVGEGAYGMVHVPSQPSSELVERRADRPTFLLWSFIHLFSLPACSSAIFSRPARFAHLCIARMARLQRLGRPPAVVD
jgi:hypothetical protein